MEYYEYGYGASFGEAEIMAFLEEFGPMIIGVVIAFSLLVMIWGILVYVLTALGLHTVAKRRGIQNPWLAWIPIADSWILGSISDQYQYVVKGKVTNRRKIMLGLSIGTLCVGGVSYVVQTLTTILGAGELETMGLLVVLTMLVGLTNAVLSITNVVFTHIALYDLYSSCCPENNVLLLVLGIIFGVLRPFFIFFNRNKDRGMPPRKPVEQPNPYNPDPDDRY